MCFCFFVYFVKWAKIKAKLIILEINTWLSGHCHFFKQLKETNCIAVLFGPIGLFLAAVPRVTTGNNVRTATLPVQFLVHIIHPSGLTPSELPSCATTFLRRPGVHDPTTSFRLVIYVETLKSSKQSLRCRQVCPSGGSKTAGVPASRSAPEICCGGLPSNPSWCFLLQNNVDTFWLH